MRRQQELIQKEDLFESGKAYRNSFFGPGSPPQSGPPQGSGYPGFGPGSNLGGGGFGGYSDGGSNLPVPFGGQQTPPPSGSFLGNLPIKDIKAFVDRMGGIEGIMNTITKMNAVMKNVQQMTPMIKLLASSFLKKGTSGANSRNTVRRKKPRRRKRTSHDAKSRKAKSKKAKSRNNYTKRSTRRR